MRARIHSKGRSWRTRFVTGADAAAGWRAELSQTVSCAALGGVAGLFLLSAFAGQTWADTAVIDTIVVTAERREMPLTQTLGSISVFEADTIRGTSANHPSELLNRAAGVNIHRNNGQEHLTAIRSPVLTGGAGAGSFLYLADGVPLRAAGFANVNGLFEAGFDYASGVEVVKGPGSVLYGSNAVHGLVNVLSRPGAQAFSGFADFEAGPHALVKGTGSVSGSVGPGAARLSLHLANDGGYRDDAGYDAQKVQMRYDARRGPWSLTGLVSYQNLNQETAGFVTGPDAFKNSSLAKRNPNPEAFRDAKSVRGYLRLDRMIGASGEVSVTPYFRWTDMDFLLHFFPGQPLEENGHQSLGVLATYYQQFGSVQTIFGLDVEGTSGFLSEVQDNPTVFSFVQGVHYDYEVESFVVSPYGQAEWPVTPRLSLEGGVRIDYTVFEYDNRASDGVSGRFLRAPDRTDDFVTVTPKLGVLYKVQDNLTAYARYARGARAPQTTDLYRLQSNQRPGEVEPENLDSIEAGLKGRLGAVDFQFAAFSMWKRNFFFRDSDGFNVSDGKTTHKGVEVGLTAPLTDQISVGVDLTYARHKYAFSRAADAIQSGNDVDTAPRFLMNARLKYTPFSWLSSELEWRHVGSYYTDPANLNDYPGHDVFVARVSGRISERVTAYARIVNLTNTDYAERADFAFGTERYFPGEDRAAFFGLRTTF